MDLNLLFPDNFLWGASTSSHQVEGNCTNNWSTWETSQRRIADLTKKGLIEKYTKENFVSARAADHYNLYEKDFDLAKKLGHTATRLSIEWSRIEPEEGKFNTKELDHYKKVITYLHKKKITPFVTLWHWTIPQWLEKQNDWETKKIVTYFKRYAGVVAGHLKDDVNFWITINEPIVFTKQAYLWGGWPPQKHNPLTHYKAIEHLAESHIQAYSTIKSINPKANIGIAKNNVFFEAYKNRLVNKGIKKFLDWWWNDRFLTKIEKHQDFIGLNQYFHYRVNYGFDNSEKNVVSDLDWELYPDAMLETLIDLKKYEKPVYITENGLADAKDNRRIWFILEILLCIHEAIQNGVDVKGYLHWSLIDNFEWDKGFWPRFGLVNIDYKTQKRTPRTSAYFYKEIIEHNGISTEIVKKYGKQLAPYILRKPSLLAKETQGSMK